MIDQKDRIKISLKKKQIITKKINGTEFKIVPYLKLEEISYILYECINLYKKMLKESSNIDIITATVFVQMETLVCIVCTNIDTSDFKDDNMLESGILEIVKNNITNYDTLKNCLLSAINTENINFLVEKLGDIATHEELSEDNKKILEMLEQHPEQAEEYLKITMANNPFLMKLLSETETLKEKEEPTEENTKN